MKILLLFSFCCLCSYLSGQIVKQDTFFYPPGEVSQIKFFSMADTVDQPMEKRFNISRGFIQDYIGWELDSTRYYRMGEYGSTTLSPELKRLKRIKENPFLQFFDEGLPKNFRKFSEQLGMIEFIPISGHAGKNLSAKIGAYVIGQQEVSFSVLEKPAWLSLPEFKGKLPPGAHEISLQAVIPPGVSKQTLRFAGANQKAYDIRLALRGYDLMEEDFVPGTNYSELKYIDASEREHLFLRLKSTEKLMNLYQGDKLRFRIPVGRQIDQIPVYHLPPGRYRMEIVDLGTGIKRSFGLKR